MATHYEAILGHAIFTRCRIDGQDGQVALLGKAPPRGQLGVPPPWQLPAL